MADAVPRFRIGLTAQDSEGTFRPDLAEENYLASVALPAISTGAFGYPMEFAAKLALRAVGERAQDLQSVQTIRFVLLGEDAVSLHERVIWRILSGP